MAIFGLFSQKYWECLIIPIDELLYFSEGWPNLTTNQSVSWIKKHALMIPDDPLELVNNLPDVLLNSEKVLDQKICQGRPGTET